MPFLVTSATTEKATPSSPTPTAAHPPPRRGTPHTADTNGGTAESGVWFGGGEPDDWERRRMTPTSWKSSLRANADRELIPAFEVMYRDGRRPRDAGNSDKPHVSISKPTSTARASIRSSDDAEGTVTMGVREEPHEIKLDEGSYTPARRRPRGLPGRKQRGFRGGVRPGFQKVTMEDDFTKVDAEKVDAETGAPLRGGHGPDAEGAVGGVGLPKSPTA
ncbi:MAG: hypothetical protein ACLSVD_01565 [Eggerthellaceae bacterium]